MTLKVITPPQPLGLAVEARNAGVFSASDDEGLVNLLLSVAQQSIDGPAGRLGRCIGEQVLELTLPNLHSRAGCYPHITLPYPPVTEIVSITYDSDGIEKTIPAEGYALQGSGLRPANGYAWPTAAFPRVRYKAGYAASAVPAPIVYAIIMMAAQLKAIGVAPTSVRRETIDGVGTWEYILPDAAAAVARQTADVLLQPFKVYRV